MKRTLSAIDDLPEEILHEILSRLGFKPLFRCKCVSKLWNSVISDPKFRQFYLQRPRSSPCHLSAVLYPNVDYRGARFPPQGLPDDSKDLIDSASIVQHIDDDAPPSLYVTSFRQPEFAYQIKASSNGLILSLLTPQRYPCNEALDEFEREHHFCVSNPLTGHSVNLPTFWITRTHQYTWAYGLATRAPQPEVGIQDCVAFKVVLFHIFIDSISFVQIDIFSSDTGMWTRKELMSCPDVVLYNANSRAISYKGILHFFDWTTRTVVTYDPYDSPDRFGSIKLPSGSGKKPMKSGFHLIHLGHEELLGFGQIEVCSDGLWRLFVWRLVNYDKKDWCLKKKCPVTPFWDFWGDLSNCKLLVTPDPLNDEFFCCFLAYNNTIVVYDLVSPEIVCFDPFDAQEESTYLAARVVNEIVSCRIESMVFSFSRGSWAQFIFKTRIRKDHPCLVSIFGKVVPSLFSCVC